MYICIVNYIKVIYWLYNLLFLLYTLNKIANTVLGVINKRLYSVLMRDEYYIRIDHQDYGVERT